MQLGPLLLAAMGLFAYRMALALAGWLLGLLYALARWLVPRLDSEAQQRARQSLDRCVRGFRDDLAGL